MNKSPKFKVCEEVTGVAFERYNTTKLKKLLDLVDNCDLRQMNNLASHIAKSKSVNPSGKKFIHLSSLEESIARRQHEIQHLMPKIQQVQKMYNKVSEDMSLTQNKREKLQKKLKMKFTVLAKRFNIVNEADLLEMTDVKNDVKDDVKNDVNDDVKNDVNDDVKNDVNDDVKDDVNDDVKDDVNDDVKDDVNDDAS